MPTGVSSSTGYSLTLPTIDCEWRNDLVADFEIRVQSRSSLYIGSKALTKGYDLTDKLMPASVTSITFIIIDHGSSGTPTLC